MSGLLNLLQNLGRLNRVDGLKPDARAYDYLGYLRWLHEGLSKISVEPRNETLDRGTPFVRVGDKLMTPLEFDRNFNELFPELTTFQTEFPFFDLKEFRQGGLTALRRLASAMAITDWSKDYAPARLFERMVQALKDSDEKAELLEEVQDLSLWGNMDGIQAFLGEGPLPAQRIYRVLHQIIQLKRLEVPEGTLPLDCSAEAVEKLAMALFPSYKTLTQPEEWLVFSNTEQGALAVLLKEDAKRLKTRVKHFGARDTFFAIAGAFPLKKDRDALLEHLQDPELFDWKSDDGEVDLRLANLQRANYANTGRGAMARCYRAWTAIALAWNRRYPNKAVDITKIHTRAEANRLLDLLFKDRPPTTTIDEDISRFTEKTGALATLKEWATLYGSNQFSSHYGPRTMALEALDLLARLPDAPKDEIKKLRKLLSSEDWGWIASEGANLERGSHSSSVRTYRAFHALLQIYLRTVEGASLGDVDLKTKDGMRKLLSRLMFGFELPDFALHLEAYANGAFDPLPAIHVRLGDKDFWRSYGPKSIYTVSLKARQSNSKNRALEKLKSNARWGWSRYTGSLVSKSGANISRLICLRAHYIALHLAHSEGALPKNTELTPEYFTSAQSSIDLFVPEILAKLTPLEKLLGLSAPLELSEEELETFMSKTEGGFLEMGHHSELLEKTSFSENYGPRDTALKLATYLPNSKSRNALIRYLRETESWFRTEGSAPSQKSAERFFKALYAIAYLYSQSPEGKDFDPRSVVTKSGVRRLVDRLVLGIEIPELSQEELSRFTLDGNGVFQKIMANIPRGGMVKFKSRFGFMNLYSRRLKSLPKSPLQKKILKAVGSQSLWEWYPADAVLAESGATRTQERIFRAHYATLYAIQGPVSKEFALSPDSVPLIFANPAPVPN